MNVIGFPKCKCVIVQLIYDQFIQIYPSSNHIALIDASNNLITQNGTTNFNVNILSHFKPDLHIDPGSSVRIIGKVGGSISIDRIRKHFDVTTSNKAKYVYVENEYIEITFDRNVILFANKDINDILLVQSNCNNISIGDTLEEFIQKNEPTAFDYTQHSHINQYILERYKGYIIMNECNMLCKNIEHLNLIDFLYNNENSRLIIGRQLLDSICDIEGDKDLTEDTVDKILDLIESEDIESINHGMGILESLNYVRRPHITAYILNKILENYDLDSIQSYNNIKAMLPNLNISNPFFLVNEEDSMCVHYLKRYIKDTIEKALKHLGKKTGADIKKYIDYSLK